MAFLLQGPPKVNDIQSGSRDMESNWFDKSILILGCGNVLIGDDGFGPAVVQRLRKNFAIPADICVFDAGTSVREILFDTVLSDNKPSKIVIVDAMDCGRKPGELFRVDIGSLPKTKLDDFSMHQIPTSNLLRELRDICGIEVVVVACQVANECDSVNPGLSATVEEAVTNAANILALEHFS
jgi:coenzyme F420 hydrogenase subunit delta